MFRYLAITWDSTSPVECGTSAAIRRRLIETSIAWSTVFDQPGLLVFCTLNKEAPEDVIHLSNRRGVVLGTLFTQNPSAAKDVPHRVKSFSHTESDAIVTSSGKHILENYWGSYALFIRSLDEPVVTVLRGAMSALPCFYVTYRSCRIFFSRVDDFIGLRLMPLSVNWDCIRAQAARGDYLSRETALNELTTLVSGERLEVRRNRIVSALDWNPSSIRPEPIATTMEEAATLLRDTTQMCMSAWMSIHKTVLLQLSGGFDSSVLLACMSRAPTRPEVIAVNFRSHGSGDEEKFARSMTKLTGMELVTLERNYNIDLREFQECSRTGNPVLNFGAYDSERRLIEIAQARGATAIASGEIGDDIFGHSPGPEMLAECWITHGVGRPFVAAAADYAERTRTSLWNAIGEAFRYLRWRRSTPYWSFYRYRHFDRSENYRGLISDEAISEYQRQPERFIHPWFEQSGSQSPGRTMLVYSLMMATSTWSHSPFGGSAAGLFMMPLASQPLVEAFLRIPCRLHFNDAQNGAVARQAFGPMLSDAVLQRGSGKGSPDMWNESIVARNRPFLREILLNGILVRERILDRAKVDAALTAGVDTRKVPVIELIIQLYIELWLRRWTGVQMKAVA